MSRGGRVLALVTLASWVAPAIGPVAAQGFRVTGSSLAHYVELRPVIEDSIPDSLATGSGFVRHNDIGLVSCPEGQAWCYFYRSADRAHTVPMTHDVEVSGWGLGQGVSVYTHIRARANLGGVSELWRRETDRFTALAAYVEVDRTRWLARAGRQWLTSQLGVNNFDGLSLALRSRPSLTIEGYAGLSLIQGLSEPPSSDVLAAADVLPPDVRGVVLGAAARWRVTPTFGVSAEYQRELRSDRAGLFAERVALDAALVAGDASVTANVQGDLASGAVNELRLRAARPFSRAITGGVEVVHSTPFFPLWTIWGVFSPVGYNEARADARWQSTDRRLALGASGGYRRYQDTHSGVGFVPLRDDCWTVIGTGVWTLDTGWEITGSYRRDIGFGASKSDGNAGVRWLRGDGAQFGITGSATQNIFEFRLANGYVVGASIDGGVPLRFDLRLAAQAGIYRQIAANTPSATVNWSQRRALVRLEWTAGRDPGMSTLGPARAGDRR